MMIDLRAWITTAITAITASKRRVARAKVMFGKITNYSYTITT